MKMIKFPQRPPDQVDGITDSTDVSLSCMNMGVKRKLDDVERDEKSNGLERQSILNISMCKLKSSPVRRVEPCLRRSVLILNTLKQIEIDLLKDGVNMNKQCVPLLIPDASENMSIDQHPVVATYDSQTSSHCSGKEMDVEENVYIQMNTHTVPSDNQSSTHVTSSNTHISFDPACKPKFSTKLFSHMPTGACPDLQTWSSNNSIKLDDVINDLDLSDLSLFDFDVISSLASSVKLTPLSVDEVLHTFPNQNGLALDFQNLFGNQCGPCLTRNDNVQEDLENIFQILVGIQ